MGGSAQPNDPFLAYLVILIAALMDSFVIVHGMPSGVSEGTSGLVLGAWNTFAGTVIGYRYGSSRDSAYKSDLLAAATPAANPSAADQVADNANASKTKNR